MYPKRDPGHGWIEVDPPLGRETVMPELQSPVNQSSKSRFPVGLNPGSPARASRVFMKVPPDPHLVCLSQHRAPESVPGMGALPRFGSFGSFRTGRIPYSMDGTSDEPGT